MNSYAINYIKVLGVLFLLLGLGACRSESSSTDVALQSELNHGLGAEVAESAHQYHKRVKPGAAVSLKDSAPLYVPAPGVYEYRLSLISSMHSGRMAVFASADDGVAIVSSETRFEFALENNGEYVVPLTINAAQEGRFYIQLHISVITDGQPVSRVIAAIVQVGTPPVVKQKPVIKSSDANSDGVIVLPAQEAISPR